jgi:hypothetical protein
MMVELSVREATHLLAALRAWQDMVGPMHLEDEYEAYFEAHEPLSKEEIDAVCRRIAEASRAARK